jgi:hypothetical protein
MVVVASCVRVSAQRGADSASPAHSPIVGTWRLAAFESRTTGGVVRYPMGEGAQGQLIYDAGGHVSTHIMRRDRPKFVSGDRARGTDEETRLAFVGALSYWGSYRVDAATGRIVHRIEGATFPNWIGTEQLRLFRIEGERLTITTPPMLANGDSLVTVLVWERLP